MEGEEDFQRRHIQDDLEQLLEDNSSDEAPFGKVVEEPTNPKLFDSHTKKRVNFKEPGSNKKLQGMMNLDMSKLKMEPEAPTVPAEE